MFRQNDDNPVAEQQPRKRQRENRLYPRAPLNRRVLLRGEDGRIVPAHGHDISVGGMQLRCEPATAYSLNFRGDAPNPEHGPQFDAKLTLPLDDSLLELNARCRLFYFIEDKSDDITIGLKFDGLPEETKTLLKDYLRSTLLELP